MFIQLANFLVIVRNIVHTWAGTVGWKVEWSYRVMSVSLCFKTTFQFTFTFDIDTVSKKYAQLSIYVY